MQPFLPLPSNRGKLSVVLVFVDTAVYIVLGTADDLGRMTILIVTDANLEYVSFAHHIANTSLNR